MGEKTDGKQNIELPIRSHLLKMMNPTLSKCFNDFPLKLRNFLKSHVKRPKREENAKDFTALSSRRESLTDWEADLDKQMRLWKENPAWHDQAPVIDVKVSKGSFCNLYVKCDVALPPDAVYNIVIDPDSKQVFKNIKEVISRKVLLDEGFRQVVELEQAAIWRFLWWSGTISVRVLVDQNREDHSINFKQVKAGFMKKFEGCWRVEPIFVDGDACSPLKPQTLLDYNACTKGKGRIGSRVSLEQVLQPAIVPPPPISWYLRGITTRTTEMLINDLIAETGRIKGVSAEMGAHEEDNGLLSNLDHLKLGGVGNIKERWAFWRTARQRRLRLT